MLLSDTDFVFTGEHRRCRGFTVPFCACLKQPHQTVGVNIHLSELSRELGFPVYGTTSFKESAVSARLLTPDIRDLIRKLDLTAIRRVLLKPGSN